MKIATTKGTPETIQRLVFDMIDVLNAVGIPTNGTERQLERMAKACMAVGQIREHFTDATSSDSGLFYRSRDIIAFENKYYGEKIADASYDDIRRKDLILLTESGIVEKSSSSLGQSTNNPRRGYALLPAFAALLHKYGTDDWQETLDAFNTEIQSLKESLERRRVLNILPVTLPGGKTIKLSYGKHNQLQKDIVESFLPRFGFNAVVLYIGDTTDKFLHLEKSALERLNFFVLEHSELSDVVAHGSEKNLLHLIEAYHSTGEWNEMRVRKVKQKLEASKCTADVAFFTAFEDKISFKKRANDIAWETEVWIAETPDHLVHFNGFNFLELHG